MPAVPVGVAMPSSTSEVGFLLHDCARLMRKRFEQRVGSLGFTRSQWQVLVHLAKNEGIHQAGLADILEVEPISLMRILDRLEARGLVERRQHPRDRRVWLLHLTEAAHPILAILRGLGERTRVEVLAGFSEADQEHLIRSLEIVKTNLVAACNAPVLDEEASHG